MISDKERTQLLELKQRLPHDLSATLNSDWSLVRWLRQYKHNVDEAETRILSHVRNRRLYGLDRDVDEFEPVEVMARGHPFTWLGTHDKTGCPIAVRQAGMVDIKGMLNSIRTSDYIRHELQQSEKVMRRLLPLQEKLARPVGMCVILDLEGLAFDPFTLSLLNSYFKSLEEFIIDQNYPMIDDKVVVLNAPRIVASLCSVLRKLWPYIDKVIILGHDYHEKLLEIADASQIPIRYGGTLTDEQIDGQWVEPEKIPLEMWADPNSEPTDTFKLVIKARRRTRLVYQNVPQGSTLSWFYKGDHDIGFSAYWVDSVRPEMVVPKHRSKVDVVPELGSTVCPKTGTYWVDFCNEHSRWTSKTLIVSVTLKNPNGKPISHTQEDLSAKHFESD